MIISGVSGNGGAGKTTSAVNLAEALDKPVWLLAGREEPNKLPGGSR